MSDWYWKVIALKAAFLLTCSVTYLRADDNVQRLPFCNPTTENAGPTYDDVMLVSTLDGKLTAFSTQNGLKLWHVETQPLLSSNLHNIELTANGKWVRLVPSLSGTLYSVSGDNVEPLPFNAEQLLSSSYKYSDDLVIAGSRETSWLGIDAVSGAVVYSCGSRGCSEPSARNARHVLVLNTHAHTVRALDPRAGNERWNFSVAEHRLVLNRGECVGGGAGADSPAPARVAVALHDGRLAIRGPDNTHLVWQHKLESPIAGLWRLAGGSLQNIDVVWEAAQSIVGLTHQPSLYVGVHDKQLYIQESPVYVRKLETAVSSSPLPWKLVDARPLIDSNTALTVQEDNSLSKITLYGPTGLVGDYGFFLYVQETCDQSVQVTEDAIDSETSNNSDEIEHHHIHVHVSSLWFWWKEVLLIAISSALLMNLMIWPRFFAPKRPPTPLPSSQQEYIVVERHYERPAAPEYSSRYENDFTPLRCLGKGGFGVVFEAKNNIDHCSYAVKRITLPKKEKKRERMLREVRALAKLEHEHIVRYFNAWVEQPPPLWQHQRDQMWTRELSDVSLAMSDEYTATSPPLPSNNRKDTGKAGSVLLNLQRPIDECIEALDFENRFQEPSKRLRSLSCNDSISIVFDHETSKQTLTKSPKHSTEVTTPNTLSKNIPTDDDSFIVFGNPDENIDLSVKGQNCKGLKSPKHSTEVTTPNTLSKTIPTDDDSFIVFGNPDENIDLSVKGQNSKGHPQSGCHVDPAKGHTVHSESHVHLSKGHTVHSESHVDLSKVHTGSKGISSGYSEAKNNSFDKRLERVKECDGYNKTESKNHKKKKGHTRHWSLDMVVEPTHNMYLYIQMQLCRRDSLHDWLRDNRTDTQRYDKAKQLFKQIVSAVEYVHLAGLIHRDLKPSNILFALDGKVKVGDFGLVTAMGDTSQDEGTSVVDVYTRHTYQVGTHLYMSPEQQAGRPYSYKVDIYSLGLILFELLQPFATESERVTCLLRLRSDKYPQNFQQKYPNETEVLKLMLSVDPCERPTASGVRARAPLYEHTDESYHFNLPPLVAA